MDFSEALKHIKNGKKVTRKGWNGKGMYVSLVAHEGLCTGELPYLQLNTVDNKRVPWLASQTDLLSDDWEVLEELKSYDNLQAFLMFHSKDTKHFSLECVGNAENTINEQLIIEIRPQIINSPTLRVLLNRNLVITGEVCCK